MIAAALDRDAEIAGFLASAGHGEDRIAPLAGDASNRRYLRVIRQDRALVLMDAPPQKGEDIRPFVAMTEWLRGLGYSAPEFHAVDFERGFLLLEDLGDALFARSISDDGAGEGTLYASAVDLLAEIAGHTPPPTIGTGAAKIDLAPYDLAVLDREARLVADWWMPHSAETPPGAGMLAEFTALLETSVRDVAPARDVVVLRDYHAENLIWLPDRTGTARVGLLDYQDALAGHAAYDLVSLLEDARRDTSAELRSAMIERYLAQRPDLDREAFLLDYSVLGAQRNLKIVGIFARLAVRDGKPRYLDLIPRVWDHLMRDLSHPALSEFSAWVARHVTPPTPETLARVAKAAAR